MTHWGGEYQGELEPPAKLVLLDLDVGYVSSVPAVSRSLLFLGVWRCYWVTHAGLSKPSTPFSTQVRLAMVSIGRYTLNTSLFKLRMIVIWQTCPLWSTRNEYMSFNMSILKHGDLKIKQVNCEPTKFTWKNSSFQQVSFWERTNSHHGKAAKKLTFLEGLLMSPSPWQATRLTNQDFAPPEL